MKVIVKDTKNKRIIIEINGTDYVRDLRNKIKDSLQINNGNFYLHYNGTILEDDTTIEDNELEDKCSIICTGQFKAGINTLHN